MWPHYKEKESRAPHTAELSIMHEAFYRVEVRGGTLFDDQLSDVGTILQQHRDEQSTVEWCSSCACGTFQHATHTQPPVPSMSRECVELSTSKWALCAHTHNDHLRLLWSSVQLSVSNALSREPEAWVEPSQVVITSPSSVKNLTQGGHEQTSPFILLLGM